MERLKSRLLIRAQELGQLEYVLQLLLNDQPASVMLILTGMQNGKRPPVKEVEHLKTVSELKTIIRQREDEEIPALQTFMDQISEGQEPTFQQITQMVVEKNPPLLIRAMLTGWLMGMGSPQPHIWANVLLRSLQAGAPQGAAARKEWRKLN